MRRPGLSNLLLVPLAWLLVHADQTPVTGSACVPSEALLVEVSGCRLWLNSWLQCDGFPASHSPSPVTAHLNFDVEDSYQSNDTTKVSCLTLSSFMRKKRGRCREDIVFSRPRLGLAAFNRTCLTKTPSKCLMKVYVLKSVTTLPQLMFNSAQNEFWNFSDSIFRGDGGFLTRMYFNNLGKYDTKTDCNISMDNIYYLTNTSIEELHLYFIANTSTELKFGPMSKLRILNITGSSIKHFPADAHRHLPALEQLSLSRAPLLQPLSAAVSLLRRLRVLELSDDHIVRLAGWVPALPNLEKLVLRGSGLCCLQEEGEEAALSGVPALRTLDVSYNALVDMGTALRGLRNLTELDASHNQLERYPVLQLHDWVRLYFAHNRLHTLPNCLTQLGGRNSMVDLELSHNQISSWEPAPDMLSCIRDLRLMNNKLAELTKETLSSLNSLRSVDLGSNPLRCEGCPLVHLREWLLVTRVHVMADDARTRDALTCAAPPSLVGAPVISVPVRPAACDLPPRSHALALGLSLGLAAVGVLLLCVTTCYRYRFEIAYSAHLLRLRLRARRSRRRVAVEIENHFLFDAFILYSVANRDWVTGTLVPLLESGPQQYRICIHERDFQLGTVIVQNISHSMDRSRHTIIVLSKKFLSSKWCLWEIDLANHRTLDPSQREFIILLELEPLERASLPRHLRFLMDTRTYLVWHESEDDDHCEQALWRLKRALGPSMFHRANTSRQ